MPPGFDKKKGWKKKNGSPTYIDPDGIEWREDPSQHGGRHWDRTDPKTGERLPEVGPDGKEITKKHLGGT